jgi:hypothetical protein
MATLNKGTRITGAERTKLATQVVRAYGKGASVRELAEQHGRSYGFIHRLLVEADATMRSRGGATRTKTKRV